MADIGGFLEQSPVARRTRVDANVILTRTTLTAAKLVSIKERGVFTPERIDTNECELEVGGKVVARGRIVKRRGRSYLKITALVSGEETRGEVI